MRTKVVVSIAIAVSLVGFCLMSPPGDSLLFEVLKLTGKHHGIAGRLASHLKHRPKGVQLALADINSLGGYTFGWSAWILLESPLEERVMSGLTALAEGGTTSVSRKAEAMKILWERTGEAEWLVRLFSLVRLPGDPEVSTSRRYVMPVFVVADCCEEFTTDSDKPLDMTEGQFRDLVLEHYSELRGK